MVSTAGEAAEACSQGRRARGKNTGGGDRARWVTGGTICRRWGLGDMKGGGGVKEPPFILLICLRDQFR